jgi:pSer/pThr/pTyr-binding forkhead associated (FHA) protein
MAYLYHLSRDGAPTESWPVPDAGLVVGRGGFAQASVGDNSLSRSHFLILREAGHYFAIDLESQNGTKVDGVHVEGGKLRDGAVIQAGESTFYFSAERLPTHARPVPVIPVGVGRGPVVGDAAQV